MPMVNRTTLGAAIAATLGTTGLAVGVPSAQADSLTGTFTDSGGTTTQTGSTVSATSPVTYLTLGLQEIGASFVGDVGSGVMAVTAAAGNNDTNGSGTSQIVYTASVTNTGPTAQAFAFNFAIGGSQLLAVNQYNYPVGTGTATASIAATVTVNGAPAFTSSASLSTTNDFANTYSNTNPYTYSSSGAAFAGATIQNVYLGSGSFTGTPYEQVTFATYLGSIDLGTLGSGQTDTISYALTASAQLSAVSGGGFEGYGGAVSTLGDPFSVSGSPAFQITAVPEPESYALMAAGLALVGSMTRRRRRTPA